MILNEFLNKKNMKISEMVVLKKDVYAKFLLNENDELVFQKYLIKSELLAEFPLPIEIKNLIGYVDEIQKGGWLKFQKKAT
jgi:hypothetical protein